MKNNAYLWICLTACLAGPTFTARAEDAESAYAFDVVYTGEVWRAASGGLGVGSRYLDNLDLLFSIDGGKAFDWPSWHFFASGLFNNGHVFNDELVGSIQGVSNIEAIQALRSYELWAEWQASSLPLSLRGGMYDLNSEFDVIDAAGLFVNPSHGIGPDFSQSGNNGPSIFPVAGLGIRAQYQASDWTVQVVALDGVPGDPEHPKRTTVKLGGDDGVLGVGELIYAPEGGPRIGVGYWRYTSDFPDIVAVDANGDPVPRNDNAGFYAHMQSPEYFSAEAERGVSLFVRAGQADARVNIVHRYVGAGAVWVWAEDHAVGLAIARAAISDFEIQRRIDGGESVTSAETNLEFTYRYPIIKGVIVQADVQRVQNPNMDPSLDRSWVFGLRFELGKGWQW